MKEYKPRINFIIPQDEEMRNDVALIDEISATRLLEEHRIKAKGQWEITTIATKCVEKIVASVQAKCKKEKTTNASINFNGVIECLLITRSNNDAEKEGNLIVQFAVPEKIKFLPYEDTKYLLIPEKEYQMRELEMIDKLARLDISNSYGLIIGEPFVVSTITTVVLQTLLELTKSKLLNSNTNYACINLNDAIECGASAEEDGINITLKPGIGCRLEGKSDSITEQDEEE